MVTLRFKPALLIVDMQNGLCHPSGTFAKLGLPSSRHMTVIPTIQRLREVAHSHHLKVIYLRVGFNENYSDSGILVDEPTKKLKGFIRGTWDAEILDELKPDASKGDIVVDQTRNTGFWKTGLLEKLDEEGIDQYGFFLLS
jgi:ureidoacrylate peracid hydrolase